MNIQMFFFCVYGYAVIIFEMKPSGPNMVVTSDSSD